MIEPKYAGFGLRYRAYIIDIRILASYLMLVLAGSVHLGGVSSTDPIEILLHPMNLFAGITALLYFPLMHASKYHATFGKQAVGIAVVDDINLESLSYFKAFWRFFVCSILTFFTSGLHYVLIHFAHEKAGFHDKLAQTRVIIVSGGDKYQAYNIISLILLAIIVIGLFVIPALKQFENALN